MCQLEVGEIFAEGGQSTGQLHELGRLGIDDGEDVALETRDVRIQLLHCALDRNLLWLQDLLFNPLIFFRHDKI